MAGVLFLVSGASGVGKSTVREHLTPRLGSAFTTVELRDLASIETICMRWRQETAEVAAARAAVLSARGQHLLLSGDPVAPAELIAAPSASRAGGVAVCLLDASPEAQTSRLTGRGDDPTLLDAHLGFSQWMREHARNPLPRLEVLTQDDPAPRARWERVTGLVERGQWHVHVVDTSERRPEDVANAVEAWIERALSDEELVMHPSGDHLTRR